MYKILSRLGPRRASRWSQDAEQRREKAQVKSRSSNFMRRKNSSSTTRSDEQRRVIYDHASDPHGRRLGDRCARWWPNWSRASVPAARGRAVLETGPRSLYRLSTLHAGAQAVGHRHRRCYGRGGRRPGRRRPLGSTTSASASSRVADAQRRTPVMLQVIDAAGRTTCRHGLPAGGHPPAALGTADPWSIKRAGVRALQDMLESVKTSTVTTLMKNRPRTSRCSPRSRSTSVVALN